MNYNALLYINEIFRNFEHEFSTTMFLFLFYLFHAIFLSVADLSQNFRCRKLAGFGCSVLHNPKRVDEDKVKFVKLTCLHYTKSDDRDLISIVIGDLIPIVIGDLISFAHYMETLSLVNVETRKSNLVEFTKC